MTDPLGTILAELAANAAVAAITTRIRGGSPAPGDVPPMIVVTHLSTTFGTGQGLARSGLQWVLLNVRCYGSRDATNPNDQRTAQRTSYALWGAVNDLLHYRRCRTQSGRVIYLSTLEVGGQPGEDPTTGWQYVDATYTLTALAQAVA